MKTRIKTAMVAVLAAFLLAPVVVRAQDDGSGDDQGASFQTFYDQLGDQGTWIQTDDYGYVWQPPVTDSDWRPYSDGHWVYTDDGWFWASNEPWGWATYHYGRWANIDGTGWVWVPGYQWAPAWVSWRYGGGYAGWAPLPPESFVGAEYGEPGVDVSLGFHFGSDVDVSFNIGPGWYNFVPVGQLGAPDCRGVIINRDNNYVVINKTTNITNINIHRGGAPGGPGRFGAVVVGGPSLAKVNAHAQHPFETVHLAAASQPGPATLQGNALAVYAPRVNPATQRQSRPASVAQTISHPSFNRGDTITHPLVVTAHVQPPAPSETAVQAAQQAQSHVPASAHIATAKTPVKQTPLTSLAPVNVPSSHQTQSQSALQPQAQAPPNPTPTYHPQTEAPPTPAPTYHTQTEAPSTPAPTYHPQPEVPSTPAPTYHPQPETPSTPAPTYHHQTEVPSTPAPTYHPQPETPSNPTPTYHPQPQAPSPPPQASHPAPQPQNGGGNPTPPNKTNDKNKNGDNNNPPPGH